MNKLSAQRLRGLPPQSCVSFFISLFLLFFLFGPHSFSTDGWATSAGALGSVVPFLFFGGEECASTETEYTPMHVDGAETREKMSDDAVYFSIILPIILPGIFYFFSIFLLFNINGFKHDFN